MDGCQDKSNKIRKWNGDCDQSDPDHQPKKSKFDGGGLKLSYHGVAYQIKLLMLFVKNGQTSKYNFRLATEMNAAEKFDDVVFKYESLVNPSKWHWRYEQAKHTVVEKKITISELKSNDGDFSLQKYFISACMIKEKEEFEDGILDEFAIVTNTNFDFMNSEKPSENELKWRSFFDETNNFKNDQILFFQNEMFKAKKFKFNPKAKMDLIEHFKSNLLDNVLQMDRINRFAEIKNKLEFTKCYLNIEKQINEANVLIANIETEINMKNSKPTVIKNADKVYKITKEIVGENVCDALKMAIDEYKGIKNPKKHAKLIGNREMLLACRKLIEMVEEANEKNNVKLNKYANSISKEFQDLEKEKQKINVIGKELREIQKYISTSDNVDNIKNAIEKQFDEGNISATVWNNIKTKTDLLYVKKYLNGRLNESIYEITAIQLAIYKQKFDDCLDIFLENFCFVTNYPDEKELSYLVRKQLGEEFNLINANMIKDSFENEMHDFLKDYDPTTGKSNFYTSQDAETFFDQKGKELSRYYSVGLSRDRTEKLNNYGITFIRGLKELQEFLSNKKTQIFHLSTKLIELGAMRVLHSLDMTEKYKEIDSFILTPLSTLVKTDEMQKWMLNAFCLEKSSLARTISDVYVIECHQDNNRNDEDLWKVYDQLMEVLERHKSKKIILIALAEDAFVKLFDNRIVSTFMDDQNSFKDLDNESKVKLLKTEVNFQGRDVSFHQLIDKTAADDIIDDANM